LNALKRENLTDSSAEIFLLTSFPTIKEDSECVDLIKQLLSYDQSVGIVSYFNSRYNQKIFFGANKINLVLHFLLRRPLKDLETAYRALKKIGIDVETLRRVIRNSEMFFKFSTDAINALSAKSKDKDFKNFLKDITKKSAISVNEASTKIKITPKLT